MILQELRMYDADKTGKFDFALESAGMTECNCHFCHFWIVSFLSLILSMLAN